ncbi:MAG: hypothetical protein WBL50_27230 [Candidatus Acidiferrum sp.]
MRPPVLAHFDFFAIVVLNGGMRVFGVLLFAALLSLPALTFQHTSQPIVIATHEARFDAEGRLLPWIAWNTALDREIRFYQQCPAGHGYPLFVSVIFLDGNWEPQPDRKDTTTRATRAISSRIRNPAAGRKTPTPT